MPLLGMGRDVPDGTMSLDAAGSRSTGNTDTSMAFFERVRGVMQDVTAELGAEFRDNLLWLLKRVITVHPLGGRPWGAGSRRGWWTSTGRRSATAGLHVVDGAVMPGPVGPNPALTIAAFADRAAERILEAERASPRARGDRRPRDTPDAVTTDDAPPIGQQHTRDLRRRRTRRCRGARRHLAFTEEMKGYVTLADVASRRAHDGARTTARS